MIEHPFLSIPAKTACPGKLRLIFSKISRATRLSDFMSSLLPLTIKHSNRFLYNVLVSQEVTEGIHATVQHRSTHSQSTAIHHACIPLTRGTHLMATISSYVFVSPCYLCQHATCVRDECLHLNGQ